MNTTSQELTTEQAYVLPHDYEVKGLLVPVKKLMPEVAIFSFIQTDSKAQIEPSVAIQSSGTTDDTQEIIKANPNTLVDVNLTGNQRLEFVIKEMLENAGNEQRFKQLFRNNPEQTVEEFKQYIKEGFDETILSYINSMTLFSHGLTKQTFAQKDKIKYFNLINYSTKCCAEGILFALYLNQLKEQETATTSSFKEKEIIDIGKGLLLHQIGHITDEPERKLAQRTVEILRNNQYTGIPIDIALDYNGPRNKHKPIRLSPQVELARIAIQYTHRNQSQINQAIANLEPEQNQEEVIAQLNYKENTLQQFEGIIRRKSNFMLELEMLKHFITMHRT